MKKITPKEFRSAFEAVLKAEHNGFRTAVGFEAKSYTYFVRSNLLPRIAKHLGLLTWAKEYYAIDAMFYEERGTDKFGNYARYAKWISVALEHELKSASSHEKINFLQTLNVPLKVLITYAAEGPETDALLRRYEAVIGDADVFNDIATLRQQLVIVGTPQTVREWQFYVYESDGFVHLLPG